MTSETIWLLSRRFLLPVLISALIAPFAGFFIPALWEGRGLIFHPLDLTPGVIGVSALFTGAGILLVGLPAGLKLARARLSLPKSLLILTGVGAIGGCFLLLLFFAIIGASSDVRSGGIFKLALFVGALPGAATALVWTLFNTDLFRGPPDLSDRSTP